MCQFTHDYVNEAPWMCYVDTTNWMLMADGKKFSRLLSIPVLVTDIAVKLIICCHIFNFRASYSIKPSPPYAIFDNCNNNRFIEQLGNADKSNSFYNLSSDVMLLHFFFNLPTHARQLREIFVRTICMYLPRNIIWEQKSTDEIRLQPLLGKQ